MKVVVQRVKEAKVMIAKHTVSQIGMGLLLFVGIGRNDTSDMVCAIADKISRLRIFTDEQGKMNLDIKKKQASVLSVSQFTLYGTYHKGNRPSFTAAASPVQANELYTLFNDRLSSQGITVQTGRFGEMMEVSLVNDGPVTFILDNEQVSGGQAEF